MTGWRPQTRGPLDGLRVAVCGAGAAVRHAGRLLASLGAVVDTGEDEAWREADGVIDATGTLPSTAELPAVRTVDTTALQDWASSGAMILTGRRAGPPLRSPGQPASVAWGALLATELLVRIGGGDAVLPGPRVLSERAAMAGFHRDAPVSADGSFRVGTIRCTMDDPGWPFVLNGLTCKAVPGSGPARAVRRRWRLPPMLVADLSSGWAGPLCGHLLTLLGARVLKVEDPARPDGARVWSREFYDLLHAGQESVAPDLGSALLGHLLAVADVVIDDGRVARPGGAADQCWIRITGDSGDAAAVDAGLVAFDADAGVAAPCGDAIAAPLTGINAALAVVACRLGGGRWRADLTFRSQAAAALIGSLGNGPSPAPAPPVARTPAGRAPELGADTERVLRELGRR
ncbi:CoA transferase [Amycolatopsis acidiphila]|uniref:CoA transferase n=1 Tax=Amycolatopsis acidiphila TaxID=715473 RepID=A0A558A4I6_9PSEU|nr:CoA transferase [Amycolatopsis acidiphila]TVT19184.1 hypothetical protein FNH06_25075 [Amycolatopsis acidiphila]UIJ61999.1 CoA transferase [Amycolatopsis acidiphila]GHG56698.1 CoA transferase [Amycolatopsis acidiphila]